MARSGGRGRRWLFIFLLRLGDSISESIQRLGRLQADTGFRSLGATCAGCREGACGHGHVVRAGDAQPSCALSQEQGRLGRADSSSVPGTQAVLRNYSCWGGGSRGRGGAICPVCGPGSVSHTSSPSAFGLSEVSLVLLPWSEGLSCHHVYLW